MNAAELIASWQTGTYQVTRRTHATFVNGVAQQGTTTTLSIAASVQPASGADLERLPEGQRAMETRAIYTTTPLLTARQGAAYEADTVSIDGADWQVQMVERWQDQAGTKYFRAVVQAPR